VINWLSFRDRAQRFLWSHFALAPESMRRQFQSYKSGSKKGMDYLRLLLDSSVDR
jgi:hypothetical protein